MPFSGLHTSLFQANGHSAEGAHAAGAGQQYLLFVGREGVNVCRQLVGNGLSGLGQPSGFKAYQWLQHVRADGVRQLPVAIICDLHLPDGTAFALHKELQQDSYFRKIPFIVLSKDFPAEGRREALLAGIDDVYPPDADALHIWLRIKFLCEFKANRPRVVSATIDSPPGIPPWKRTFDILAAVGLLLVFGPLFVLISLLIWLEGKGPVFYVSKRAGKGFQVFDFYKFRTMVMDAEDQLASLQHLNQYRSHAVPLVGRKGGFAEVHWTLGPDAPFEPLPEPAFVKIPKDPRVTRLGRFLRCTSMDELPQLFNVLLGDMSIVGNRPLPLYEAEKLTTDQWARRFLAPSGITGLWQIMRAHKPFISDEERKQLDLDYAKAPCLLRDLWIIVRTLPALIQKDYA